jgi:hypothetical protein
MSKAKQRYLLVRRLPGQTPMLAFQATHPTREGQFRIDILSGLEPDAQQAYLREQRMLAALAHPHLLPLVETSALPDGTPICVSRWPEGSTLEARLIGGPPLRPEAVQAIVVALEDALAAAHARGIGHGSVRADQVLLSTEDGRGAWPWLFGFGTRHLLGQAPDSDADQIRDQTALAALAARMRLQASAAPARAPVKQEIRAPARTPRRIRHWVGLGVGATVGAALTAVLTLTWQPSTARPPLGERPSPPIPSVAVERPAPVPPPPVVVPPPAPVPPPPSVVVESPPPPVVEQQPPPVVEPQPVVRAAVPRPRAKPRTAPPAQVRRGLVWSAREQRLIQVDEQGLPVEQTAGAPAGAPPAPAAPAPGVVQ